jgi:hypothetical protein
MIYGAVSVFNFDLSSAQTLFSLKDPTNNNLIKISAYHVNKLNSITYVAMCSTSDNDKNIGFVLT